MKAFAVIAATIVIGCGAESNGNEGTTTAAANAPVQAPTSTHSMLVDDSSKLPACDATTEGAIFYVKSDSSLQACAAGSWTRLNVKGEKGDKGDGGAVGATGATGSDGADGATGENGIAGAVGATGANGATGVNGKDGTDNRIEYAMSCTFDLDNSVVKSGANGLESTDLVLTPIKFFDITVRYAVEHLSSGDLFASLSIEGRDDEQRAFEFYSAKTTGAVTGKVSVTRDVAFDKNAGFFTAEIQDDDLIISYTDDAHLDSYNNFGTTKTVHWTRPTQDCALFDYRD